MPTTDYHLDGEPVPGVTTILANLGWKTPALMKWAHKMGASGNSLDDQRDSATGAGSLAHALIANRLGVPEELPEFDDAMMAKAQVAVAHWAAWYQRADVASVIAAEVPLVSRNLRCGGCPDLVYEDKHGRVWIADWKTSEKGGRVYKEHRLQLAAYAMLWDEVHPDRPVRGVRVVPLPTTMKLNGGLRSVRDRVWGVSELEADRQVFCALRVIHDQAPHINVMARKVAA